MEYLDIVDEQGNPTGERAERKKAHLEGIPHRTSHVWLVRLRGGKLEVLLQKRCEKKDSFPGCYDISSAGHIPAGVDFIPSALRELKEELGIEATAEELVYCGDRTVRMDRTFRGIPFHDRQFSRVFFLWRNKTEESDFHLQEEEVSSVRWMEFETLLASVRDGSIPNCIAEEELLMLREAVMRAPSPLCL